MRKLPLTWKFIKAQADFYFGTDPLHRGIIPAFADSSEMFYVCTISKESFKISFLIVLSVVTPPIDFPKEHKSIPLEIEKEKKIHIYIAFRLSGWSFLPFLFGGNKTVKGGGVNEPAVHCSDEFSGLHLHEGSYLSQ